MRREIFANNDKFAEVSRLRERTWAAVKSEKNDEDFESEQARIAQSV